MPLQNENLIILSSTFETAQTNVQDFNVNIIRLPVNGSNLTNTGLINNRLVSSNILENFGNLSKSRNKNKTIEGFNIMNSTEYCSNVPSGNIIPRPSFLTGPINPNDPNGPVYPIPASLSSTCTTICNDIEQKRGKTFSDLCKFRAANDARYATWINQGMAWWLSEIYINSDSVVFGEQWEGNPMENPYSTNSSQRYINDPARPGTNLPHIIPRWWWIYPEIPDPSTEWLTAQDVDVNTNRLYERRVTHLPPPSLNVNGQIVNFDNLPNRVYLTGPDAESKIRPFGATVGYVKYPISEQVTNALYGNNPVEDELYFIRFIRPDLDVPIRQQPSFTQATDCTTNNNNLANLGRQIETFTTLNNNGWNQSWVILSIIIVIIIIILFFVFHNNNNNLMKFY